MALYTVYCRLILKFNCIYIECQCVLDQAQLNNEQTCSYFPHIGSFFNTG